MLVRPKQETCLIRKRPNVPIRKWQGNTQVLIVFFFTVATMESRMLRESMDFEPELVEIDEKLLSYRRDHVAARISRQRQNPKFRFVAVMIAVMTLFLTIVSNMAATSCTELLGRCMPEVTVKIQQTSEAGKKLLEQARAGLRLATYLAKDLAVKHEDGEEVKTLSMAEFTETVDTFTDDYTFHFAYKGFCRESDIDHLLDCLPAKGLDILSCLVEDIGLQLGNVSKAEDGTKVASTLVDTFQKATVAFATMWEVKKSHYVEGKDAKEDAHMSQLRAFYSARTMQSFSAQQYWLADATTHVSAFATVLFALAALAVYFPSRVTDFIQKHHRAPVIAMALIQFAVQSYMVAGLIYYLHRVYRLGRNLEVALVTTGSGSWLLTTVRFVISAAVLFLVIKRKRDDVKNTQY